MEGPVPSAQAGSGQGCWKANAAVYHKGAGDTSAAGGIRHDQMPVLREEVQFNRRTKTHRVLQDKVQRYAAGEAEGKTNQKEVIIKL